jgi:ubiquinone/menaquinone biosynthesis C-methylase UbiE
MSNEVRPDAFNAFEAAGWETKAGGYDDFFGQVTTRVVDALLDAAAVGPGKRTLDVATGPGYVSAKVAERGADGVGIDIAQAMVELARLRHPELEFRTGDAEALPFEDGSFDAVIANFVLLHLGRPERAAAEFARVLAPGGAVALTVWDRPERARFLGLFLDAVAEANASPPENIPVGPPFFRFSDDREFERLLADQGLEAVQVRTIAFIHQMSSSDQLWSGVLDGTVRTSALILGQTEEVQGRIRLAFDRMIEDYRVGDRLEVPVSVKLGSGRKPGRSS